MLSIEAPVRNIEPRGQNLWLGEDGNNGSTFSYIYAAIVNRQPKALEYWLEHMATYSEFYRDQAPEDILVQNAQAHLEAGLKGQYSLLVFQEGLDILNSHTSGVRS